MIGLQQRLDGSGPHQELPLLTRPLFHPLLSAKIRVL